MRVFTCSLLSKEARRGLYHAAFLKLSGNFSAGASYVIHVPCDTLWEILLPDARDGGHSERRHASRQNS